MDGAIVISRHGGPEVLEVQERPDPAMAPGHVRIEVAAAGVNFADTMARTGLYPDAPKPPMVGSTGIVKLKPLTKITHDIVVNTTALITVAFQLNSSLAQLDISTSRGSEISMPRRGMSTPKTPTDTRITISGFHAKWPTFSPSSVSMVRALNSTMAPSTASRMPSPNGK